MAKFIRTEITLVECAEYGDSQADTVDRLLSELRSMVSQLDDGAENIAITIEKQPGTLSYIARYSVSRSC